MPLNPLDDFTGPPVQDFIVLGGLLSPGRARVESCGSPRNWDKRKGYGFSGATLVYTGADLASFSVFIDLWEDPLIPDPTGQWVQWDLFSKAVLDKPLVAGPIALPMLGLGISHPLINGPPLGVHSVVVEDVTQFTEDDYGLWTCEIKLIEYRAPLPALGRPNGSIPAASKTPAPPDKEDLIINAQLAQFNALAAHP